MSEDEWDNWDGNEKVGYYSLDQALNLARLWKAGKMIGGDEEQVIFALLRHIEQLK